MKGVKDVSLFLFMEHGVPSSPPSLPPSLQTQEAELSRPELVSFLSRAALLVERAVGQVGREGRREGTEGWKERRECVIFIDFTLRRGREGRREGSAPCHWSRNEIN